MPLLTDLITKEEIIRLRARIKWLTGRVSEVSTVADAAQGKRFRLGSFQTALVTLGGTVVGNVVWSSPMPSDVYSVDATLPAAGVTPWSFTVSAQTANGCTITFTAPVLLALGTIVMVAAVSPAN